MVCAILFASDVTINLPISVHVITLTSISLKQILEDNDFIQCSNGPGKFGLSLGKLG